jgi:nucleoside-diphosphate-sugar epimerase
MLVASSSAEQLLHEQSGGRGSIGMRIFVSGATGVVGRRVVPLLIAQGHAVTAVVRGNAAREYLEHAGAACAMVDLFDVDGLERAVDGHDTVINLATHMPSSAWKLMFRGAWRANDRIRTEGVANLIAAALRTGVSTFVQESLALTYPDRGNQWIDETTALDPADYNRTVLDAEKSVMWFSSHGHRGVTLRFAAFYGPDAMQVQSYIRGLRVGWALLPGDPNGYISSVSHDDAATAVIAALDAPAGVYTVADDDPVSRAVYFESLADSLGLMPPRFLPQWAIPLFGAVGHTMARSLRLSNRKLKQATNWRPRYPSVREGWSDVVKHLRHHVPLALGSRG